MGFESWPFDIITVDTISVLDIFRDLANLAHPERSIELAMAGLFRRGLGPKHDLCRSDARGVSCDVHRWFPTGGSLVPESELHDVMDLYSHPQVDCKVIVHHFSIF